MRQFCWFLKKKKDFRSYAVKIAFRFTVVDSIKEFLEGKQQQQQQQGGRNRT